VILALFLISEIAQPLEAVEVKIWRQPDLSGRFIIDQDTILTLPLIGKINCGWHYHAEIETMIINGYNRYLRDPHIEIEFLFPVRILGEVNRPGVFYLKPGQTLADLLAEAGGFNGQSNPKGARLVRGGRSRKINLISILEGKDDFELKSNDLIIVPRSFWSSLQKWGVVFSGLTLLISAYNAFVK